MNMPMQMLRGIALGLVLMVLGALILGTPPKFVFGFVGLVVGWGVIGVAIAFND